MELAPYITVLESDQVTENAELITRKNEIIEFRINDNISMLGLSISK